ncbi:12290_t:CDS:1, partial [Racocetra fulgida]
YLDTTSNLLTILDLHSTPNLVELKCSNNPISNLTLTQSSKLVLFDCLGVRFGKNNVASTPNSPFSPSTSLSPTVTIYSKDPTSLEALLDWVSTREYAHL